MPTNGEEDIEVANQNDQHRKEDVDHMQCQTDLKPFRFLVVRAGAGEPPGVVAVHDWAEKSGGQAAGESQSTPGQDHRQPKLGGLGSMGFSAIAKNQTI